MNQSSISSSGPGGPLIFLVGPTAIGKTGLALDMAERFNCEIVGVDSMQVYRLMDIGTAKPTAAERGRVVHHLVDYVMPDEEYNAARFVDDCLAAIGAIRQKGRLPLLTGGTGLYFKALQHGIFNLPVIAGQTREEIKKELAGSGLAGLYNELKKVDPATAARVHENDKYRIVRGLEIYRQTGVPWSNFIARQHKMAGPAAGQLGRIIKIGLQRDRDDLYKRINKRVDIMIEQGLLAEVEGLLEQGFGPQLKPMQSLGYRHMVSYLQKKWSWAETLELLARDTRRYAKRQLTWFNADQEINWHHHDDQNGIMDKLTKFLNYSM